MVTVNSIPQPHLTQPLRKEISSTRCPGKCPVLPMEDPQRDKEIVERHRGGLRAIHLFVPSVGDERLQSLYGLLNLGVASESGQGFRGKKVAAIAQDALRIEHERM